MPRANSNQKPILVKQIIATRLRHVLCAHRHTRRSPMRTDHTRVAPPRLERGEDIKIMSTATTVRRRVNSSRGMIESTRTTRSTLLTAATPIDPNAVNMLRTAMMKAQ